MSIKSQNSHNVIGTTAAVCGALLTLAVAREASAGAIEYPVRNGGWAELQKVLEQVPVIGAYFSGGSRGQDCDFICDVKRHLPDTFRGCFGDLDGNGVVNPADRAYVSINIGQTDPVAICLYDLDGNGHINAGDRGFVLANSDQCTKLPDYQDGSGLNRGEPDPRFCDPSAP